MDSINQRQEPYKNILKFLFSLVIWGLLTACWAVTWMQYYADITFRPFGYKGNWAVVFTYGILLFVFTAFYGGYRIGYYSRGNVALSGILALVFTNAVTYLQLCLIGAMIVEIWPTLIMTAIQASLVLVWAFFSTRLYIKVFPPRQMLMVYGGDDLAKSLVRKMISRSEKYVIREAISIREGLQAVTDKIDGYGAVVLCDVPAKTRNRLLKYCFSKSIRTYTTPKISDILIRGAVNINLFDTPLLLNRNLGLTYGQRFFKRLMDLVISGIMLVVFSPFMLLTALAVKVYDRGPVFYKQKRLTRNSKEFYVYKFRSMIVDAEKKSGITLSTQNDDRITSIGKFIRMTRLDELPQLLNIFKGDMSLVGPRPERPELTKEYLESMPEFAYRLKVKAGLTGYAQVVGRYNTTPYDKLKMDLMYIAGYNLFEDFRLLFMTVKIMFVRESTEGIDNGTAKDSVDADAAHKKKLKEMKEYEK